MLLAPLPVELVCSFRTTLAIPPTLSRVVLGAGLAATLIPPTLALTSEDDPLTPLASALQVLEMRSAVTRPWKALAVATEAAAVDEGPAVEPEVLTLRMPADSTSHVLATLLTQMLARLLVWLPPVAGSATVGSGPEVTLMPATVTLMLSPKADPLTVFAANAGEAAAVARASAPARA